MSFLRWSKRPSRMDVGCVAEPYDEQTEQAQKDLLVVVEYLAERTSGVGASGEDITQAAHICSLPFHSLTEPQRVEVWQFLNRLCRLIAPATVEGLRAARHKHTSRYGWSALFLGVVVTFILAILLQAYALFGTQTLNRLNQLNKEAQTVFDQINALEQRQPNLYKFGIILDKRGGEAGSATEEAPKLEWEWKKATPKLQWEKATPEYSQLRAHLDAINLAKSDVFGNIYQWNAIWAWLPAVLSGRSPADYWGFNCSPSDKDPCKSWIDKSKTVSGSKEDWEKIPYGNIQIRYGSEALARSNLDTLQGLFLPSFYGALGAWVWLLRERYCQVRDRRLRAPVGGEYLQRVLLGAVFGATLGYFNLPGLMSTTLASFSMIGLAFIIGYNVEIMFWLFDRLFDSLRVKDRAGERERTKPASPKALQLEAG